MKEVVIVRFSSQAELRTDEVEHENWSNRDWQDLEWRFLGSVRPILRAQTAFR